LTKLLEALLGRHNVSNIPLQEIVHHKFKRADLYGKLANTFADLDHAALRSTAYFKALVSGDTIDAERKYGQPFSFRPFARLFFSANRMPVASDASFAYHRRWIILPFPNRFEGKRCDPDLLERLTAPSELSYLLNRAVAGLRRLWESGEFTAPPSVVAALSAYRRDGLGRGIRRGRMCHPCTGPRQEASPVRRVLQVVSAVPNGPDHTGRFQRATPERLPDEGTAVAMGRRQAHALVGGHWPR